MNVAAKTQRLGDFGLGAHVRDVRRDREVVAPTYDVIAPCYDAFTTLCSFGMDGRWKRAAVHSVVTYCAHRSLVSPDVLDLASGTGDLANEVARRISRANVSAVDASPEMVRVAVKQLHEHDSAHTPNASRVRTSVGDMTALAVRSQSVDVVMAGYGVRNVPDPNRAVREMRRVLRDGGQLVLLDLYRPETAWWRNVFLRYLACAGGTVGWLWHQDPMVYGDIAGSIDQFMSWRQCQELLERNGFRVDAVTRYVGGGVAQHTAIAV